MNVRWADAGVWGGVLRVAGFAVGPQKGDEVSDESGTGGPLQLATCTCAWRHRAYGEPCNKHMLPSSNLSTDSQPLKGPQSNYPSPDSSHANQNSTHSNSALHSQDGHVRRWCRRRGSKEGQACKSGQQSEGSDTANSARHRATHAMKCLLIQLDVAVAR